ncbi:MAG: WYL domain-containing protein [Actinobacteria bacterium]|nr:WYL domain-containing protein [Actinomycetota bacterium]
MGSRLERTERLLNLVFCLMAAQRPVPRSAIRSSVAGYDPDGSTEAFERMFERDKEELRGMGIPIDTVLDVNGDVAGYRIVPASYRLIDVDLTAEERSAVALAARVWQGATLSEAALQAALKLSASAGDIDEPIIRLPEFARITANDSRLLPLIRSTAEGHPITFDYRGIADDDSHMRTIDPWAVITRNGNWYVVGFDHVRVAPRAFRVSRIRGPVHSLQQASTHPRPDSFDPRSFVTVNLIEPIEAVITMVPGGGAELLRRATALVESGDRLQVSVTMEREDLVGLLAASRTHIESVIPGWLLDDVDDRISTVVALHSGVSHD